MIKLYYTKKSVKYKNAIRALEEMGVDYKEINLKSVEIEKDEFLKLIQYSTYGIYSTFKSCKIKEFEDLSLKIKENPDLLDLPILIDTVKNKVVEASTPYGFIDELRVFVNKSDRNKTMKAILRHESEMIQGYY